MPYSRADIENARRELQGEQPRRNDIRAIPPDAIYVGPGPLYVWDGSAWLDYNKWIATTAPIRPEKEK